MPLGCDRHAHRPQARNVTKAKSSRTQPFKALAWRFDLDHDHNNGRLIRDSTVHKAISCGAITTSASRGRAQSNDLDCALDHNLKNGQLIKHPFNRPNNEVEALPPVEVEVDIEPEAGACAISHDRSQNFALPFMAKAPESRLPPRSNSDTSTPRVSPTAIPTSRIRSITVQDQRPRGVSLIVRHCQACVAAPQSRRCIRHLRLPT